MGLGDDRCVWGVGLQLSTQRQSAASAKPASLEELWESLRPHMAERKWTNETYQEIARFEEALRLVEASPAAERTALSEIRKRIERESYWCEDCQHEIPKGADYLDDLHADHEVVRITIIEGWLATEIDAQERAGVKAE